MDDLDRRIQELIDIAEFMARKEIERLAREIMRKHPHITDFAMACGMAVFHREPTRSNKKKAISLFDHDYLEPLRVFIDRWDAVLGLTGRAMRIVGHAGEVEESWDD